MDFDKLKDKGKESLEKFNLNDLQLKGKWEQIKGNRSKGSNAVEG